MRPASSTGGAAGRGGIGRGIGRAGTDGAGFGAGCGSGGTACGRSAPSSRGGGRHLRTRQGRGRGGVRKGRAGHRLGLRPERLRRPGLEGRDLGILRAQHGGEVAHDAAEQPEFDRQFLDLRPQRRLGGFGARLSRGAGPRRLDLEQAPGQQIDLAGQLLAARLQGGDTGQGETAGQGGGGAERHGTPERQEHREWPEHDEPEKADRQQPRIPAEDRDHRLTTCRERAPVAGGHPERTPPGANRITGSLAGRTGPGKAPGGG